MKKKFWTARLKTILIIALVVAICAAVTLAIATGTSVLENVVGTILSPIRSGIAAIEPNCVSGMIAARSLIGA